MSYYLLLITDNLLLTYYKLITNLLLITYYLLITDNLLQTYYKLITNLSNKKNIQKTKLPVLSINSFKYVLNIVLSMCREMLLTMP